MNYVCQLGFVPQPNLQLMNYVLYNVRYNVRYFVCCNSNKISQAYRLITVMMRFSFKVSFDEFIAWYTENSECRYELHDGVIVEMPKPRCQHSEIAGFLST